ncbi:aldose epimerase [Robertmurraya kyonggiensis]|uniref:Aldose epimerase n=1 Tax=Robertmurraya kyonggiensis TaxID=1037680 RepID=A0A4V5P3F9_9BACI|nr:aldose epimerase [Robertmurraya kyonggiensis]TKC17010.1 aldose epimerase [Robertmurraya kyonggiensis]
MYEVKEIIDQPFKIYELRDINTNSWVKVAPERGGIVFSYGVAGEEILYLNEETFYDTDKNVRGGIPILFPISGQLLNGMYDWEGRKYSMSNHGFARNASWEVIDVSIHNRASITISLSSNEKTRNSYPFDFNVTFNYILENGKLTVHQEYKNMGNEPLPMYAGFHPYFKIKDKNISYETDATKYFDYNDGKEKYFNGSIDISNLKEAVVLLDAARKQTSFYLPQLKKKIKLKYDEPFKYVMIWSESDEEFICVEPWMAKTDEFNRKEELVMIGVNKNLSTVFSILLED